jgi:hypothetical protein
MADFCNQCKREMGLGSGAPNESDYPDYGPLEDGHGWPVICEGCGFTLIDRQGNCVGRHSVKSVVHKQL